MVLFGGADCGHGDFRFFLKIDVDCVVFDSLFDGVFEFFGPVSCLRFRIVGS